MNHQHLLTVGCNLVGIMLSDVMIIDRWLTQLEENHPWT